VSFFARIPSSLVLLAFACGGATPHTQAPKPEAQLVPSTPDAGPSTVETPPPKKNEKLSLASWLQERLPKGGSVQGTKLVHTVRSGDNAKIVAAEYLELTEVYHPRDLEAMLTKQNPQWTVGATVEIPKPLTEVPGDPEAERLPLPDEGLRGVFLTGPVAAQDWQKTIDNLASHGMNAVVLDGKDYMGPITYPTQVKLAIETHAKLKNPPIPNLARAIRFAHMKKIHVIMRNSCFHDPLSSRNAPRTAMRLVVTDTPVGTAEWFDPTNDEAQSYIVDLVKEQALMGADEIQLDYVRFPIHMPPRLMKFPDQKERSNVIFAFVKRVHEVTQAHNMSLSLDLFGVAATGIRDDIEKLGQDIAVVSQGAEAISPMVYPSHYNKGYNNWEIPGDHAEIVGIGTKAALDQLKKAGLSTHVRSWIQAFPYKSPAYSAAYIAAQAKSAEANGGKGWLMWNPGSEYSMVWKAFPVVKPAE
jgi:hypothetical protein